MRRCVISTRPTSDGERERELRSGGMCEGKGKVPGGASRSRELRPGRPHTDEAGPASPLACRAGCRPACMEKTDDSLQQPTACPPRTPLAGSYGQAQSSSAVRRATTRVMNRPRYRWNPVCTSTVSEAPCSEVKAAMPLRTRHSFNARLPPSIGSKEGNGSPAGAWSTMLPTMVMSWSPRADGSLREVFGNHRIQANDADATTDQHDHGSLLYVWMASLRCIATTSRKPFHPSPEACPGAVRSRSTSSTCS